MSNKDIEWADLTGYGLHLKTFYFKDVFGFNNDTIGSINLLIDTLPVIRVDKAKKAGLICLVGQPAHNIYEDVDVNNPESLLMSPTIKPPNLFQIPTTADVIIEPAKFISQLGLPLGSYRKVSSTQEEVDRLFYEAATPILNKIKLMLQAQFPYVINGQDQQVVSGPFGHYLLDGENSIEDTGQIELLLTEGDLKDSMAATPLSKILIKLYRHNPLSTADINNIIDFSCQKQPEYNVITVGDQQLIEPIMPTQDYEASTEQLFYFSESIKSLWTTNIQSIFLKAVLEDSFSKAQIEQQSRTPVNKDDFKSRSMVLPQAQDWLLDLCESDKNNPFHQQSVQSDLNSYKTPLFISYQIARLLSVDGMHEPIDGQPDKLPLLLDMTAGFGNLWPFLSNCSITAFESNSNTFQYLSSISREFSQLRRKNAFLPEIRDLVNKNVLTTSLSSSAHGDAIGYDYILATPDFAVTNHSVTLPFPDSKGTYHFEVKSNRLDHHIAVLGLQHLRPNGRMVFLLDVEKPQAISRVESYFYQYLHAYFNVELIIEMGASLFYGSGHDGNVRLHVIAGKRKMPIDEAEIIERTQAALHPKIPIVLNDLQLNNVVQHYIAGKYKKGRFDKLISNDVNVPLRMQLTPKQQQQLKDIFEKSTYSPYTAKTVHSSFHSFAHVNLFSNLVDSLPPPLFETPAAKQLAKLLGMLSFVFIKKSPKYSLWPLPDDMPELADVLTYKKPVVKVNLKPYSLADVGISILTNLVLEAKKKTNADVMSSVTDQPVADGAKPVTNETNGDSLKVDIETSETSTDTFETSTDTFETSTDTSETSTSTIDAPKDNSEISGDSDETSKETNGTTETALETAKATTEVDNETVVIEGEADHDLDNNEGGTIPSEDDLDDNEGGAIPSEDESGLYNSDSTDIEIEPSKTTDVQAAKATPLDVVGVEVVDKLYTEDDNEPGIEEGDNQEGQLGDDPLEEDANEGPTDGVSNRTFDEYEDYEEELNEGGEFDDDEIESILEAEIADAELFSNSSELGGDTTDSEEVEYTQNEHEDDEEGDGVPVDEDSQDNKDSDEEGDGVPVDEDSQDNKDSDTSSFADAFFNELEKREETEQADSNTTTESTEGDNSQGQTDDDKEVDIGLAKTDGEEEPFKPADEKLEVIDAIENLKQSRLARISMSRPQTLAMVKQVSLTSKATGYVPRLIVNTQLNLYQKVPNTANDLFSLTSNIDAWIYKTFNLNFKASQSIFSLLPDFSKHATAYYCTEKPENHVIFDVSRRSQYFIACMVILHRLKQKSSAGRRVLVGYGAATDFVEIIHAFESLACSVGVAYEKDSNPERQIYELIRVLSRFTSNNSLDDIESAITFSISSNAMEAAQAVPSSEYARPLLLLIGDDFITTTRLINQNNPKTDNENLNKEPSHSFDQLVISSFDIFNVDNMPNFSDSLGADAIFELLPYYITDNTTNLPKSLLTEKRLFFYFYEVCLKKASHFGLIQYHYEPLTYAKLPVRHLKSSSQEGMTTLIDTFYHLNKQMKQLDAMTTKIGGLPHCTSRSAAHLSDEYFSLAKMALNTESLKSVIADNYKNGKYSTLPVTSSYSNIVAEYLIYTHHFADFITYLKDPKADASQLLLKLFESRLASHEKPTKKEVVVHKVDSEGYLPTLAKPHADQALFEYGHDKTESLKAEMVGYRAPNIKNLLEFIAKRVSMVVVDVNETTMPLLASSEVYGDYQTDEHKTVLCDATTMLSGANEAAFVQKADMVRKFVSMIPANNISALPYENLIYEMSCAGINCEYISPNTIKYVVSRISNNGVDHAICINIQEDDRTVFNFSDDVYSAKTDAVFIDMNLAYHPYVGIAPLRYSRFKTACDQFRQRSVVISELLPPNTIKELIFKLSVPDSLTHKTAMVVTDYIDVDFSLLDFYGEFSKNITHASLEVAGCLIDTPFKTQDHNHYLALLDLLKMPQVQKIGLYGNKSVNNISHADVIDVLYEPIKAMATLDSQGQSSVMEMLFKYIDIYKPLYPNGYAWYQSLFYTNYELKASPVYSGSSDNEVIYPTVFEYSHVAEFIPSVSSLTNTARHFMKQQFSTITTFVLSMTKASKENYYNANTNDIYESFAELTKPLQVAHIYSTEFTNQNLHAFKGVALNEFGLNLNRVQNITATVYNHKNAKLIELYKDVLETNNQIAKSAEFVAKAFNHTVADDKDVYTIKDFAMDVAASSNNVDADTFLYGFNHTASKLRSNSRQLYAMALGLLLPKIGFTDAKQPRFALMLSGHLSYAAITNQHDRLIFLSKSAFKQAWTLLGDKTKLVIKPNEDKLSPFIDPSLGSLSSSALLKLESNCASYSKAFNGSDDSIAKSAFTIMKEGDLVNSVNSQPWSTLTGAYDIIRFSNNTNHYFIHIVEKTTYTK